MSTFGRLGRRGRGARVGIERLEDRRVLAVLGLESATVKPDGRIIELVFSGSAADGVGMADHVPAWGLGGRLTTSLGTLLEPLGTVVTVRGDQLVWTSTFLVSEAQQAVTFDTASVVVSGPERLIRDDRGNWTEAFGDVAAENMSLVDVDGFTTNNFQRGVGGVTLYVSNYYGNNARTFAQAQNPATPLKTVTQALSLLSSNGQNGRGAAVRLLRGDVFTEFVSLSLGGQDRRHPFVLEDYWYSYGDGRVDPRTRPVIQTDWSSGQSTGFRSLAYGGAPLGQGPGLDHVVIRRIAFRAVRRVDPYQQGIGVYLFSGGRNWTLDDIDVSNYSVNLSIEGYQAPFYDFTILRSIVTDAHLGAPPPNGAFGAAQGMFARGITGLLVSQNVFDRNGRTTSTFSGRNEYSHNVYLSSDHAGPATVWGNVITNGGSHGVQLRPGGVMAYNYLGRNAIAAFIDGVGGVMTHNVVEASEDIAAGAKRGHGLTMATGQGSSLSTVIEQNILVHSMSTAAEALIVWQVGTDTIADGVFRNNTSVNAGAVNLRIGGTPNDPFQIELDNNLVDARNRPAMIVSTPGPVASWDWLNSHENAYGTLTPSQAFRWWNTSGDLARWRLTTGSDLASIMATPVYVNLSARIGSFAKTAGGTGTEADYLARVRGRRLDMWNGLVDMRKLFTFYSVSYRPTNLPSLGEGPLDFYGAVDYRPTAPDLVSYQDTGASNTDNVTRTNAGLRFEVRNTLTGSPLALLRNGVVVATAAGNANGAVALVDTGTLADGVYTYAVRQTGSGGVFIIGPSTRVEVDRTPPSAPPAPELLSINGKTPSFYVPGATSSDEVQLLRAIADGAGPFLQVATRRGSGVIDDTTILVAGNYEYVTRVVDLAGNVSSFSLKLKVTIV